MQNIINRIDQENYEYHPEIMQNITALALTMIFDTLRTQTEPFKLSKLWAKTPAENKEDDVWFAQLAKYFRNDSLRHPFNSKARLASCLIFWASNSANTNCKNVADGLRALRDLKRLTPCCDEEIDRLLKRIAETAIPPK